MMKKHALTVILLGALVLLAAALLPPDGAAQPQPTLVLSPASGPCDAEIQISGTGFPTSSGPYPFVTLYLLQPGSADVNMAVLTRGTVGHDGTLTGFPGLLAGCHAAALDSQASQPTGHLVIAATTPSYAVVDPGARIPDIIATAQYAYTTTAPPSQLTMVLSPSSGPCYGAVEVMGRGFPVLPGRGRVQGVYLLRPGTTDVSMSYLTTGNVNEDGAFSEGLGLQEYGCEAAALDSQTTEPTGYLAIAAGPWGQGPPVKPGERIPNIIAVAQYRYTTTTHPPPPVMAISPSSGPCDATLEVSGRDFPAGTAIRMDMGVPKGDGTMGTLATLVTDSSGRFAVTVNLGALGCRAATLDDHYSGQLWVLAVSEGPVIEPSPGVPPIFTRSPYTYTTMQVGGVTLPNALPATGGGPGDSPVPLVWFAVAIVLAAVGLALVAGWLYHSKRLRS